MVGGPAHVKMPANAWLVGNPTTTARRHYILCLEPVRRHRSCLVLDIIEGDCTESNHSLHSFAQFNVPAGGGRGSGIRNVVPVPGPPQSKWGPLFPLKT